MVDDSGMAGATTGLGVPLEEEVWPEVTFLRGEEMARRVCGGLWRLSAVWVTTGERAMMDGWVVRGEDKGE